MKIPAGFDYEKRLWDQGIRLVVGIDEVGRGAWAGPVVAAAVIFPPFSEFSFEIFESKLLPPKSREKLSKKLEKVAKIGIGEVDVPTINKIGIGKASQKAFRKAVMQVEGACDYYLIDAFYIKYWSKQNQLPIKHGDRLCASIAAASIVAKVYRDRLMKKLAGKYPQYGFEKHKGYGTMLHRQSIGKFKLSDIHRRSFNLEPYLNG